jgi:hypothetical protein
MNCDNWFILSAVKIGSCDAIQLNASSWELACRHRLILGRTSQRVRPTLLFRRSASAVACNRNVTTGSRAYSPRPPPCQSGDQHYIPSALGRRIGTSR